MRPDPGGMELLSGWGRSIASAAVVLSPESPDEVADAIARVGPRGVLPRGLGRSYGDAALNAGGTVISTARLGSISAGEVVAGAGASLKELLHLLVPRGLSLPVLPGTAEVTVGGALAADVHGKNHHVDGAFSSHVSSFRLAGPEGVIEVSKDTDVFDATAGGMGLTGVIIDATLQTEAIETAYVSVDTDRAADIGELMELMSSGDDAYKFSVAWVDCFARGRAMGRGVLARANYAPRAEMPSGREPQLCFDARARAGVPDAVPTGALMPIAVRAFNEFRFRRSPRRERNKLERFSAFFHPLDVVAQWNRLYGHAGFLQYQFVVPFGAESVVTRVIEEQVAIPSYLAVLKRMGAPSSGLLSFPISGWTLALDFPVICEGLGEMLDRFDEWVVEAGGRVYLAKDSRMRPEVFRAMYAGLDEWREVRDRLDPAGVFRSDLSRRLGLQE